MIHACRCTIVRKRVVTCHRDLPEGPALGQGHLIRFDCTWEFVFHPCASSYLCQKSGEDFELPQHREFKHPQILCIQRTLSRRWLVALLCRGNCFCCWYRGGSGCWCRRLEPLSLGQKESHHFPLAILFSPLWLVVSVLLLLVPLCARKQTKTARL